MSCVRFRVASWPLAASVACALVAVSPTARADDTNIAVAEALFRDARTLMAAGDLAQACPKFEESNRVDPKLGTLMNLALCHEKAGLSASAWAEYARAASLAARAGQSDREKVARERAAALELTLSHVLIDADPKSDASIVLDDQPIGPAAFHSPIPIDPGAHVLRATAPGATPFEQSFRVTAGATVALVKVPVLARAPTAVTAAPETVPAVPEVSKHSGRRTAGFVVGGVGVALAGVGAFFGARAFSDKSAAENGCGAMFCTPAGSSATSSMKTDETLSTVGVIAGVAAIGAGVYLVLSSGGESNGGTGAVRVSLDVAARGLRGQISW